MQLLSQHPQEIAVKIEVRGVLAEPTDVDYQRTSTGIELVIITDYPIGESNEKET